MPPHAKISKHKSKVETALFLLDVKSEPLQGLFEDSRDWIYLSGTFAFLAKFAGLLAPIVSWSRIFAQSVKVYPIIDSETNYDEETSLYISI